MAASTYFTRVEQLYIAFYQRPADPSGLLYWSQIIDAAKGNAAAVVDAFATSAEAIANYGPINSTTIGAVVDKIYLGLFGHLPDAAGKDFYVKGFNAGTFTPGSIAVNVLDGATASDAVAAGNKLAAALTFTQIVDGRQLTDAAFGTGSGFNVTYTSAEAVAAAQALLAGVGSNPTTILSTQAITSALQAIAQPGDPILAQSSNSFTLTPGTDVATANSFFASQTQFNVDGKGPTLNTGDRLTGMAGKTDNTLYVTDLTAGVANNNMPAGLTLTNIQNVTLNSSGNTAGGTGFSTVGYTGVTKLTGITNGGGADVFAAANGATGTVVNATHNGFGGGLTVVGGTDVTATTVGGAIVVGNSAAGRVPLATEVATGAIVVNQNFTGAGAVNVFGGTTVNVTTSSTSNAGVINVGNTAANTGNSTAGKIANASGDITISTRGTGAVNVFGGKNVAVTDTALSGAGTITVGDATRVDASNQPAGTVVVTETAAIAYNGLAGSSNNNVASGAINVSGGTDVTITTNAANAVNIGNLGAANETSINPTGKITVTNTGTVDAATMPGAVLVTGGTDVAVTTTGANVTIGRSANAGVALSTSNPTGNVTVTESMNGAGFARAVIIDGGVNVTVNAKGQNVTIGGAAASAPTGAVVVTQADVFTGNSNAVLNSTNPGNVTVNGGTTVTVNTTGGNVAVGAVVAGVNTVPSGAVAIKNTFSGPGADTVSVQGGTTVDITTTKSSGAITVGAGSAVLNAAGTALKDANLAPTGNVTIVNATTAGSTVAAGNGVLNVNTNGATTVSVKGTNIAAIADIQSTLATGGSNAGKAIGTSTLKTVVIDSQAGAGTVALQSDALTEVSILNQKNTIAADTVTITNNTAAHALTITQGGNSGAFAAVTVVDALAGALTITDNGTASTKVLRVDAAKATSATINNAAAASLQIGAVSNTIATVTLKGAGATTFAATDVFGAGNLSKALTVDASAATGAVTASISPITTADTTQQYLGGSGADTVTVNSNASGWGNLVKVDGGSGSSDVLVASYAAAGTDVAMGNAASVKGFEILRLGATADSTGGAYDASGFGEVQTGVTVGALNIINAASGASLTLQDNTGGVRTIAFAGANTTALTNGLTVNLGTGTTKVIGATTGAITANGYETLTVNSVGKIVTPGAATQGNAATINGVPSNGAAGLVVGGVSDLTLTSNVGFTSINASGNTGAAVDVSAAKVSNSATTFTGGAAKLTAVGSNDTGVFKALVTLTGTATNNWTVGKVAVVTLNQATYTYTAPGNATAATVAAELAAAITADATTGNVVKGGAGSPAVTAVASGGNIVLSKGAAFELGTTEDSANATIADTIIGAQQQIVLESATAVTGAGAGNITVTFAGGAAAITIAVANSDTTAQIATKIAAGITAAGGADKPGIASAIVVDNTKVLITVQQGEISQLAVGGTAAFVGAGVGATDSSNFATVNNAFVTGAGGGDYKVGLGGSWNTVTHKFSSGSETVTLDASTAKADTLQLKEGAVATDNGSKGGVTKFTVGSQAASDVLSFRNAADNATQAKTILANALTGVVNTVNGAATMANVLDSSGALNTKLANLTYTISNGVITFSATGGHSLSEFSSGELVSAAQILVASSTTGGANKVAAFSSNGRSYVVSSDNGNTLFAGVNNNSSIVELKDVASVKGFGSTFGDATIVSSTVTNITGAAVDLVALAANSTLDYTGFAVATLNVPAALATASTKATNLAASAELVLTGGTAGSMGFIETTQTGASGLNSLTVTTATAAKTIERLTVNGDALVKFNSGTSATVTELTDATNTMNTIQVVGAATTDIAKVTGTALTTVNAVAAGNTFTFGTLPAPDTHNNLAVSLAVGQAANIRLSGTGDTITQGTATTSGAGAVTLNASGSANTILLSDGANTITANGATDKISVGAGGNLITATGADDVFNIAPGAGATTITVGSNATVNLGTLNAGTASIATTANAGAETIKVNGAVTGGTADTFAKTTITFANLSVPAGTVIDFDDAAGVAYGLLGATVATSQVNVSSAASLKDALNLAANFTLLTQAQGTAATTANLGANTSAISWFQYGGDTYVVAMVNNTAAPVQQTALDANDIVVKLVGMVDLTGSAFNPAAGVETLTL